MNEPPDSLEEELSSLRPRDVTPELRRRLTQRLGDRPRWRMSGLSWLAIASGLAAACLAVALLRPEGTHRDNPDQGVWTRPESPALVDDTAPTLFAYERALAGSPDELDERLDRDAARVQEPAFEFVRLGALTRSALALNALLGDD
jgi:hypothetical protein